MQKLSYDKYLDKVYGCWMGKSLGGTIGGPYEGRKELFDYTFDKSAVATALPNDDLDLQVLWLHVLEQKGLHFTTNDLADAFLNLVPYAPGEYAIFKKNYARGLYPPLTGKFNNHYYINGMGCPIRSEIWACICPGNPAKAAAFAVLDGQLDHEGDSIRAEQFLCAIETAAFLNDDLEALVTDALPWLGEETRIRRLVDDTLRWCGETDNWREVWRRIIRDYGHPDCTNLYQNIGITVLALKHGRGDFIQTLMIGVNSGFDADCSCATAGAILGILIGAKGLADKYGFTDPSYKLGIPVERKSYSLDDLAAETCRIGVACTKEFTPGVTIIDAPEFAPLPTTKPPPLKIEIDYGQDPVIGWGESKQLKITLTAREFYEGNVELLFPEGWKPSWTTKPLVIAKGATEKLRLSLKVPKKVRLLSEKNILQLKFEGTAQFTHAFGLIGAQVWKVWGPYWKNFIVLPKKELGAGYFDTFPPGAPDATASLIRQYHLNTQPVTDVPNFPEPDGSIAEPAKLHLKAPDFIVSQTREDRFAMGDLIGFQGPCTIYAERLLHSPVERTVCLQIGCTDPFKLWLNGKLLASSDASDWWTGENHHIREVKLLAGENHLLMKLVRRSTEALFSPVFTEKGTCTKHIDDLGSYIPKDAPKK
jgi:hypothetical protein